MLKHLTNINGRFKNYVDEVDYLLDITGQTIYLCHLLNDLYDNNMRRIYIQTNTLPEQLYLFRKDENRGFYISRLWNTSTTYSNGDIVNYKGNNYLANSTNTNKQPDNNPTVWTDIGKSYYLTENDFIQTHDFTIVFPSSILINSEFELRVMKTLEPYIAAGKKYNLINS
ncbi:MAG: hypothetical protein K9J21_06895 [Bacteroidales bacterium]|nr:hypothetical protein [Bacteroidales bacterium]